MRFVLLIVILLCVAPYPLFAEGGTVKVDVMAVEGFRASAEAVAITGHDSRLDGVQSKLRSLGFATFTVNDAQTRELSPDQEEELLLNGGHNVMLKRIGEEQNQDGKHCIWLSWRNSHGDEILNTRLHLPLNQSMVVGTEQEISEHGDILVLKLSR